MGEVTRFLPQLHLLVDFLSYLGRFLIDHDVETTLISDVKT